MVTAFKRMFVSLSERLRRPALRPGEPPISVFVSSVMSADMQSVRDAAVRALDRPNFSVAWAFEHTPASSDPVDLSYLRKVREADIVVWLVGATTTQPVVNEIGEAIASDRRLWVVRLAVEHRDSDTTALLEKVKARCKMSDATDASSVQEVLTLTFADEVARAIRGRPSAGRLGRLDDLVVESRARCIVRWQAAGLDSATAVALADDVTLAAPDLELVDSSHRVRVLTGDFGSGKSLLVERLHQMDVSSARHPTAPVPVYLDAGAVDDLRSAVEAAAVGIGQFSRPEPGS
jgi:hypothetical protein